MTITWGKEVTIRGNDKTITIIEKEDGVEVARYSARMHKSHGIADFKPILKKKIKAARAERNEAAVEDAAIDLSGFEDYINQ